MTYENLSKLVVFRLGNEEFAFTIDRVQSIELVTKIRPIPNMPSFVLGLINLREAVIPVMDLNNLLNIDNNLNDYERQIIIVSRNDKFIGFIVDEAKDVMNVTDDMLHATSIHVNGHPHSVTVVKKGDQLISILDVDELFANMHDVDLLLESE